MCVLSSKTNDSNHFCSFVSDINEDMIKDCCISGRNYAAIKQDVQHFIQLDQLNLDRRRKSTAVDHITRQTNLVKLFSKIHLNRHFYTNSSICEQKERTNVDLRLLGLPINNVKCQLKFTDCCLDEQLQFAIGIDLALRTRFKQNRLTDDEVSHVDADHNLNHEIEYSIAKSNEVRSNCNLLTNKTSLLNKSPDEQAESIKMLSIGQNVAFDSCEACSVGIDSMDQFESESGIFKTFFRTF